VAPHPQIAFVRDAEIWTVPADGGTPTQLTSGGPNRAPAWSPAGDSIVFQSPGGIAIVQVGTGAITPLTNGSGDAEPAWSPDGAWVAFVRGGDIYRVPAGGGDVDRVIDVAQPVGSPTWSPNSCHLAFAWNNNVLRARSSDGSGIVNVRSGAAEPNWGPDNRLAVSAITGGTREVHLVNPDGSGFTRLTVGGGLDPSWAGAGGAVVFEAPTRPEPGIFRENANGSGLARVTDRATDADPAW
jgi:Tol biopolymer transport system component